MDREGFPHNSVGKESACNAGDLGLIPELGRSPGKGKGYPLQYSGLENSMDCIVDGVAKRWTWLSDFHFHFHFHDPITIYLFVLGLFSVGLLLLLCFMPREVPLAFVVKLVWWCWILLAFACLWSFTFRPLIHFELIFMCGGLVSFLTCSCPVFPALFIKETLFSPLYSLASFVVD